MNIEEYKILIKEKGVEEYPWFFIPDKDFIYKIIQYNEADIDLKIYLARLILCRSYYGTYTAWYQDVEWFYYFIL
jgi:hypothetical protein